MKKGLTWLMVLLLVFLVPLCAFAGGEKEGAAEAKAVTVTVRMGSWWKDALPGIVEKFQADHPNIKFVT